MNTVLAGYGLVKKYGSATALAGVDVEVGERDSLAIMGPSGSGKSTLLHTLAGIVRPDGGEVLLRGERGAGGSRPTEGLDRIDQLGENRLSALRRKRFGFVFQSGQLLPELPAEENVYVTASDRTAVGRFAEVSTATLALSFLVATTSAGLTAAAGVLDRRRVYGLLRLAGTPLKVLDRARVRETVIPLVALAGGTTAIGVYASYRLNKLLGASINATGALELAACVAVGALAMFAAIGGSRPLLRRVTEDAARSAD
ncbi:ATP-binding cassette domain-containing protein [Streptomyces shaanxiensis]